jgi:tripartite-type tricarboxylate transporter receptor subunit TctC
VAFLPLAREFFMTRFNRRFFAFFMLGLASLFCKLVAAQTYPVYPIKLIVPYTPGGGTDAVARLLAEKLSAQEKWTVLVENRAGGNGNIGMEIVAKARADGYTLGLGQTANLAINPSLVQKMPYDALADFVPVALIAKQAMVLVVRTDSSFKSLADILSSAKHQPESMRQALAGTGTVGHLVGELLAKRAGVKFLNVPYKGAAPALTDLMGGQTDLMFSTPQSVLGLIKGGKLRALAVSSATRVPVLPQVPTIAELGFAGFEAVDWKMLVAPKGTPAAVIRLLNQTAEAALSKPATIAKLLEEGSAPMSVSPEFAATYLKNEFKKWGNAVREAKLQE